MIIFLNEDRAYHSWVTHHRSGYVLDGLRRPSKKPFTIHRAGCSVVRLSATRRTHWTTGKQLKACAAQANELLEWARRESGQEPLCCEACSPLSDEVASHTQQGEDLSSLPRLTSEILEYLLDTAVIHLDHEETEYRVSANDVARYLNKTVGQIASRVFQLRDAGLIQIAKQRGKGKQLSENALLCPTATALQTLPIFKSESARQLAQYFASLQNGCT